MSRIRSIQFFPGNPEHTNGMIISTGETFGSVGDTGEPLVVGSIDLLPVVQTDCYMVRIVSECKTRCCNYPNAMVLAIEWCDLDPEESS